MADPFFGENRFGDPRAYIGRAKLHATDDPFKLGLVTEMRTVFWYERQMLKEAKSEPLRAAAVYGEIGATAVC